MRRGGRARSRGFSTTDPSARFVLDIFDATSAGDSPPEGTDPSCGPAVRKTPAEDSQTPAEAAVRRAADLAEGASRNLPPPPDGGPLSPAAARAVREAELEGNRVHLTSTLERSVYQEVAEAFARLGGRWVRGGPRRDDLPTGYHAFPRESAGLVRALAETGRLPPRNPTAFFPSPPAVVQRVIEAADLGAARECRYRFLEPHAGQGAIADHIRAAYPECPLDVVEILDLNRRVLRHKGYEPIAADFLHFDPGPIYDRILANPPFRLPGAPRAYQQHLRHAWGLLAQGGVLVSVAPGGVLHARREDREFHRWLADRGTMEELPSGAFRESGTGVETALIRLEKRSVGWKRQPYMGWRSWNAWQTALWADNCSALYDAERRIHARIAAGEYGGNPLAEGGNWSLIAAVRAFYEEAAEQLNRRPLYAGVYLADEDHPALLTHLIERYREHSAFATRSGNAPTREAA